MKNEVSPLLIIWAVIRVILMIPAIPFIVVYSFFTAGVPAFAKGYREGQIRHASAVLRKYADAQRRKQADQGADGPGQGAVLQPEWCNEEEDSEDDRLGLELAPRTVTVRMISATANSPEGNGAGRKAIRASK